MTLLEKCKYNYKYIHFIIVSENQDFYSTDSEFDRTPLIWACYNKNVTAAFTILSIGISPTAHVDKLGYTALSYACCSHKMEEIAMILLTNGNAKQNQVDSGKYTALMHACNNSMPFVALAIINSGDCNYNNITQSNISALYIACEYELSIVALTLLSYDDIIINIQTTYSKETALMYACKNDMITVALAIIEHPNCSHSYILCEDIYENSTLKIAQQYNLTSIVEAINKKLNTKEYKKELYDDCNTLTESAYPGNTKNIIYL